MAKKGQGYAELETSPAVALLGQGLIAPGADMRSWDLDKVGGTLGGLVKDSSVYEYVRSYFCCSALLLRFPSCFLTITKTIHQTDTLMQCTGMRSYRCSKGHHLSLSLLVQLLV